MSHTSTAPNGTLFIHNSDLSGDVEVNGSWLPGADLVWLVSRRVGLRDRVAKVVMGLRHGYEPEPCPICDALIDQLMEAMSE